MDTTISVCVCLFILCVRVPERFPLSAPEPAVRSETNLKVTCAILNVESRNNMHSASVTLIDRFSPVRFGLMGIY